MVYAINISLKITFDLTLEWRLAIIMHEFNHFLEKYFHKKLKVFQRPIY
jgi:hypothetical protein